MTKDEALRIALEALEGNCTNPVADPEQAAKEDKAITAIKEALAQPEQEPVAWMTEESTNGVNVWLFRKTALKYSSNPIPLYTSPPASKPWVGLTDEDKQIAFDDTQEGGGFWEFADAIEAKLKEKNT